MPNRRHSTCRSQHIFHFGKKLRIILFHKFITVRALKIELISFVLIKQLKIIHKRVIYVFRNCFFKIPAPYSIKVSCGNGIYLLLSLITAPRKRRGAYKAAPVLKSNCNYIYKFIGNVNFFFDGLSFYCRRNFFISLSKGNYFFLRHINGNSHT